jgi:6-phosphogluconate dehydrogenase (decarboxylating)
MMTAIQKSITNHKARRAGGTVLEDAGTAGGGAEGVSGNNALVGGTEASFAIAAILSIRVGRRIRR